MPVGAQVALSEDALADAIIGLDNVDAERMLVLSWEWRVSALERALAEPLPPAVLSRIGQAFLEAWRGSKGETSLRSRRCHRMRSMATGSVIRAVTSISTRQRGQTIGSISNTLRSIRAQAERRAASAEPEGAGGEDDLVEDVVRDTWVAALGRGPRHPSKPRG